MHVYHGLEQVPADLPRTVVSIGVFDGVHRGHQEVLSANLRAAKRRGLLSLTLTFDPHPSIVHRPDSAVPLIGSVADRLELLAHLGIDVTVVQPYSLDWARQSAERFVDDVLLSTLHADLVVAGQDSRFGAGNEGDAAFLEAMGRERGFDVEVVSDQSGDIAGRRWSSTWIRELLDAGDVRGAAIVLGRPHRLRGTVQHGHKRGRELGYPTANLDADGLGVVPADGVYAGWLIRPGRGASVAPGGALPHDGHERLAAAISIGTNPVFDGVRRTVEAHVLGRSDLDLYGEEVALEFVDRLRPMIEVGGVEALLAQMRRDVADAARILGVPAPGPLDPASITAGRSVAPGRAAD